MHCDGNSRSRVVTSPSGQANSQPKADGGTTAAATTASKRVTIVTESDQSEWTQQLQQLQQRMQTTNGFNAEVEVPVLLLPALSPSGRRSRTVTPKASRLRLPSFAAASQSTPVVFTDEQKVSETR